MSTDVDAGTAVDLRSTPGYKGDTQIILNAVLIAGSTIVVSLRLYARLFMLRKPGLDDVFAFVAFGLAVALSAMEIKLVEYGSGTQIEFVSQATFAKFYHALVTQSFLYFWATCFMRLAIVAFLPRIFAHQPYLRMTYAVGAVTLVSTIVIFLLRLTACTPISDLWLPPMTPGLNCMDSEKTNDVLTAHSVLGIIIDACLMAIPLWVVYTIMLPKRRSVQIALVFSVGVFVVVTGIVRFVYICVESRQSFNTYSMTTIGIWTDLEAHVGLWCGCFPAMQPILRRLLGAARRNNGAGRLEQGRSRDRKGYERSGGGVDTATGDSSEWTTAVDSGYASQAGPGVELGSLPATLATPTTATTATTTMPTITTTTMSATTTTTGEP